MATRSLVVERDRTGADALRVIISVKAESGTRATVSLALPAGRACAAGRGAAPLEHP